MVAGEGSAPRHRLAVPFIIDVRSCNSIVPFKAVVILGVFTSRQWEEINLLRSGQCGHCYAEQPLSSQGKKQKNRKEERRKSEMLERVKHTRGRKGRGWGAYGVLAGLFLGCYSYWVMRRKRWTLFHPVSLFSFVPPLLLSRAHTLH